MEIKPTYVTFEQAKLLKEKGFYIELSDDINYGHAILMKKDSTQIRTVNNDWWERELKNKWLNNEDDWSNYTQQIQQWQVVEWVSLVHNIDIEARPVRYAGDVKASYYQPYINGCIINMSKFKTRQQAYSVAFDYVLNNLI